MRHAVETAQPAIDAKSHQIVVHYAAESVFVDGDHVRLSQVVSNLLNNAAKFTPPGGRIEVTVRATEREALVAVKDSGIGFERGDELHMFDIFVQLDLCTRIESGRIGTRARAGSSGHRDARRSGGSAQRRAGSGLAVPAASAARRAARGADPMSELERKRSVARCRVLVVDDNADAADTLGRILTIEGFDVRVYHDPAQALRAAREFKPEVAFIDLNMPGMSGIELATHLRAEAWASAVYLVALTGMGQKEDLAATRRAGFDVHLTKPAQPSRILEIAAGYRESASKAAG